jgi:hypothetical protein
MYRRFILLIFVVSLVISLSNLKATENDLNKRGEIVQVQAGQKDSTSVKLKELEKLIIELKTKIEKKDKQAEFKKLLEEATNLSTKKKKKTTSLSKKFHTGVRQQSGLNPNISLGGDFFAAISSSKDESINEPSNISYGNNKFEMREMEVAFVAPLDPFTRGKSFISFTKDALSIEEAYMEWLNLPLSLNLKTGIFYADFGILNRYHDHALPQFDRPKALVNLFSNKALSGYGFGGNFLLPRVFFADASTFDLIFMRGGMGHSFTDQGKFNLLTVSKLKNFYDITDATFFEWTLSGAAGKNDASEKYMSYVGDLGITLKWVPVGRAKYRTIDWKTELLYSKRETPTGDVTAKGFYTSLQNKISARYWLSCRAGYSELPWDKNQYEWDVTACVDFWQSDFVFFRLQYQYSKREFDSFTNPMTALNLQGPFPDEHTMLFHVCWAMGPHKHEAY